MGVVKAEHFSLKKGIKLFGDKAEDATTTELRAIYDMDTYEPLDASKLTREEKRDALEFHKWPDSPLISDRKSVV